jgi:hypothetical protein
MLINGSFLLGIKTLSHDALFNLHKSNFVKFAFEGVDSNRRIERIRALDPARASTRSVERIGALDSAAVKRPRVIHVPVKRIRSMHTSTKRIATFERILALHCSPGISKRGKLQASSGWRSKVYIVVCTSISETLQVRRSDVFALSSMNSANLTSRKETHNEKNAQKEN